MLISIYSMFIRIKYIMYYIALSYIIYGVIVYTFHVVNILCIINIIS